MSVKLREGERLIEDFPLCSIIEIGGPVHYSLEFRVYLMGLPPEQRQRIVCEIEERARVRRFVRYKDHYDFSAKDGQL